MKKQQICILGSTGSVGTQALDVIEQHSDLYEVYCLTANNRVQELAEQARDRKGSFSRKGRQRSEEQAVKGSRDEGCQPGIAGVFVEPVLHRAGAEI